ncbi:MAG: hypothetical protein RL088_2588 [Verrucomicrobiota bacterium]|jgi:hypothetical protein
MMWRIGSGGLDLSVLKALLILVFCVCFTAFAETIPIEKAIADGRVNAAVTGNGRDSISVHLVNASRNAVTVSIAAGSVFAGESGERQIVLRTLDAKVDAQGEVDAVLPAAALSSANTGTQRALKAVPEGEPRIAPLLPLFAKQNDLPRPTAQLAVFVVMEDLTWESWTKWLAATRAPGKEKQPVTPAEVAQAVDGLAFVKLSNPAKPPALLADEALKRLALRNPWARGKAMALYGMTVDNALTGDPALPPDLNQLLHTAPNDNCPICRQRQKVPEFP